MQNKTHICAALLMLLGICGCANPEQIQRDIVVASTEGTSHVAWSGSVHAALRERQAGGLEAAQAYVYTQEIRDAYVAYSFIWGAPPAQVEQLSGLLLHTLLDGHGQERPRERWADDEALSPGAYAVRFQNSLIEVKIAGTSPDGTKQIFHHDSDAAPVIDGLRRHGGYYIPIPSQAQLQAGESPDFGIALRTTMFIPVAQRLIDNHAHAFGNVDADWSEVLDRFGMEPSGYWVAQPGEVRQIGSAAMEVRLHPHEDLVQIRVSDIGKDSDADGFSDWKSWNYSYEFERSAGIAVGKPVDRAAVSSGPGWRVLGRLFAVSPFVRGERGSDLETANSTGLRANEP